MGVGGVDRRQDVGGWQFTMTSHSMTRVRRRAVLRCALSAIWVGAFSGLASPLLVWPPVVEAEPLPAKKEADIIAKIARETMRQHDVPALSLAIAKRGQCVYRHAFGVVDKGTGEQATPDTLFRIASLTKPITSVAIFSLIEQGRLSLGDRIFGEHGRLGFDYAPVYPDRVTRITLHHLLTHTAGGWGNGRDDPTYLYPEMDHRELIRFVLLTRVLSNEPGTHYEYSNFGYSILGRVIEKMTGQPYSDYVQQSVLHRCGIHDMALGGNTLTERAPHEAIYYDANGSADKAYEIDLRRRDSHGGWIATPSDLVRFTMHVDGEGITPSILTRDSIKAMTTPSAANSGYACGWAVNGVPNWWHDGRLPGSAAIMVRTASGLCWAAFANTQRDRLDLDQMMWRVVRSVPAWHA